MLWLVCLLMYNFSLFAAAFVFHTECRCQSMTKIITHANFLIFNCWISVIYLFYKKQVSKKQEFQKKTNMLKTAKILKIFLCLWHSLLINICRCSFDGKRRSYRDFSSLFSLLTEKPSWFGFPWKIKIKGLICLSSRGRAALGVYSEVKHLTWKSSSDGLCAGLSFLVY